FAKAMDAVNHDLRPAGHLSEDWDDWIAVHFLMREATALIPDAEKSAATTSTLVAPKAETPEWQIALTNAGWKFTSDKQDDGTWELVLNDQPVTDISMLRGAQI